MSINIFVIISGVLNTISKYVKAYETLIAGRLIAGIVAGSFCGICSIYLAEIAPQNIRGTISSLNALSLVSGSLIANIISLPAVLGTYDLWPILMSLMLITVLIHTGLFFAVESPKWLYIKKGRIDEAEKGNKHSI